jgi:hypothetical protein
MEVLVMATSSFQTVITINKKSAVSLVNILEKDTVQSVNLSTNTIVKKADSSDVEKVFEDKLKNK